MKNLQNRNPQDLREKLIRQLDNARMEEGGLSNKAKELAEDLFALDLTVYSRNYSFSSLLYNSFSTSLIDDRIALHPEQIRIVSHIEDNDASIISAPTSFGKTFCVFEYIIKHKPHNIVLIVPTLALVDEYFKKIIKKYKDKFSEYKIHTGINEDKIYNFTAFNIFILTHDRIVQETAYSKIEKIDFLVIDEVYKLETDSTNNRVLVFNMAYYYLAKKAKKYTLLAPFISNVENCEALEKCPVFFNSQYSPVVNDIITREIIDENDRFIECKKILKQLNPEDKTLIYFPTVSWMYKYINNVVSKEESLIELHPSIKYFIEWAKEEIHEEWCLITALERGYLIHNGQILIGTRMFQLDFYEQSQGYNRMLCTSTLLEGVNTTAKNIIITKPSRHSNKPGESFSAFDFYNLVGRTGRLYQHYIGDAYYIQSPNDPVFYKKDAVKSIKFEITDDSKDIDIQKGLVEKHQDVVGFLHELGISITEYLEQIGSKVRFNTVVAIYQRYLQHEKELLEVLVEMKNNPKPARHGLVSILFLISEGKKEKVKISMITSLLNKQRPRIKKVVDNAREHSTMDINFLISTAIKMKNGYIEHTFYNYVTIIRFFMVNKKIKQELLSILDDRILNTIEFLYFTMSKHKKMLLDMGIYERDVEKIIRVIGDDFDDAFELKQRLSDKFVKLKDISYISRYIIQNML